MNTRHGRAGQGGAGVRVAVMVTVWVCGVNVLYCTLWAPPPPPSLSLSLLWPRDVLLDDPRNLPDEGARGWRGERKRWAHGDRR